MWRKREPKRHGRSDREERKLDEDTECICALLAQLDAGDVRDFEVGVCRYLASMVSRPDYREQPTAIQIGVLSSALNWSLENCAAEREQRSTAMPAIPLMDYQPSLVESAHALASPDGYRELMVRLISAATAELQQHGNDLTGLARSMAIYTILALATPPGGQIKGEFVPKVAAAVGHRFDYGTFAADFDADPRDVGPRVLTYVYEVMQIDDQWSVRGERSFTWWGHRLAQTVTAEPLMMSHGHPVVRIRAECEVLRDVPDTSRTFELINELNVGAGLDALVYDSTSRTIRSQLSGYFHTETAWLVKIFATAVAHQVAIAEARAELLAEALGSGEIAVSGHPQQGLRLQPDQMLEVVEDTRLDGQSMTTEDFGRVAGVQGLWVRPTLSEKGFASEFPFYDAESASLKLGAGGGGEAPATATTAMLTATDTPGVPWDGMMARARIGAGMQLRLGLPVAVAGEEGLEMANVLNLIEWAEGSAAHQLGSWCIEDGHLWFNAYVPALSFRSLTTSQDRSTLLLNLLASLGGRARWARRRVDPHLDHSRNNVSD